MKRHQGQALIYGLFVLIIGLAALFFLFNTGQLSREKTKLVNTADAVAYSAGLMNARGLNFNAYTNRAMVANTVAIAQLVSLSSWVQYADNMATYGYVLENPKFFEYYPAYWENMYSGPYFQLALNESGALERLARTSDQIIRNVLMNAQQVANTGLLPARKQVMDEVAAANYRDDGEVIVDPVPLTVNEYLSFIKRYQDDERTRFAEVAERAAKRDLFLDKRRRWDLPGFWSDCPMATATGRVDWLDRAGGTELLGFDEWRAMDSLSEKRWVPSNKSDLYCSALIEVPAAWGALSAAENPTTLDPNLLHYNMSVPINPASSALAMMSSDSWDYSGLPAFYELSAENLAKEDPRMLFAIRVRRKISETVTSEGRSAIRNTDNLNRYRATPAGGDELVSVSASEVFFRRDAPAGLNQWGGSKYPNEIGSLFNPYWQVRLIHSANDVRKAQAMQGVVLP